MGLDWILDDTLTSTSLSKTVGEITETENGYQSQEVIYINMNILKVKGSTEENALLYGDNVESGEPI